MKGTIFDKNKIWLSLFVNNVYRQQKCNIMKKLLILSVVFLAFAAQAQIRPSVPSYDELKKTGYEAYQSQDYKTAYQAFHAMDSVYGITDFIDLL